MRKAQLEQACKKLMESKQESMKVFAEFLCNYIEPRLSFIGEDDITELWLVGIIFHALDSLSKDSDQQDGLDYIRTKYEATAGHRFNAYDIEDACMVVDALKATDLYRQCNTGCSLIALFLYGNL